MKFSIIILAGSLCLLVMAAASAVDSVRCGSRIINIGDDQDIVLKYCGEPIDKEGWIWTYNRGPEELSLTFHFGPDGTVDQIKEGEGM